jgi:hypothetical protein
VQKHPGSLHFTHDTAGKEISQRIQIYLPTHTHFEPFSDVAQQRQAAHVIFLSNNLLNSWFAHEALGTHLV